MPTKDEIDQQWRRLHGHRGTLAHYLDQISQLGSAYTPPGVSVGIREAREGIARCKAALRGWGVPVEDLPDDSQLAPPPQPPSPQPLRQAGIDETPGAARQLRVFLCHASEDKSAVRQLYRRLRAAGITPWLDAEDLLPGQRWQAEIPRAVREADVALVCLSPAAVTKAGYVQDEIGFALDVAEQQPNDAIYLIPLRLEACEAPERLRHLHWVDMFADDGFARLLRALRVRAVEVGALPPVAQPAALAEELPPATPPAPDSAALRGLWQQARSAYATQQWARAETLLTQVAALDASYHDVQARLAEARRHTDLQRRYETLMALHGADHWEEALTQLDALDRVWPGHPDPQGFRAWAEGRQLRERRYEASLEFVERAMWPEALRELEALLAEVPDDEEAAGLLAHAKAMQAAKGQRQEKTAQAGREAEARRQPEDVQRRQRERFAPVFAQIQVGAFDRALARLNTLLAREPADREAVALVAQIIETPAAPLAVRLRAAELAGKAGDPRIPVDAEQWRAELARRNEDFGKPAGYWCSIAPGTYTIGGWEPREPSATVQLPAFWVARYPITIAQYAPFVAKGYGAGAEPWWTKAGWQWKRNGRETMQPYGWGQSPYGGINQPVSGVTWYEATAFCAWLSEQLRAGLPAGYVIRLPSEAEWEVAAAYDGRGLRRLYPWGNEAPTVERAIYDECQLGRPAPVGCCPSGAAACGALDMVGNVWEWAASSHEGYPAQSGVRRNDFAESLSDVPLRGGSWLDDSSSVHCGARDHVRPVVGSLGGDGGLRVIVAPRLAH